MWAGAKYLRVCTVCACVSVNTDTPHITPHVHLEQAAAAYLRSPRGLPSTHQSQRSQTDVTHTHTRACALAVDSAFTHTHTLLPSQFKKAVAQKSADVFTLGGANIVVSKNISSEPEREAA